MTHYGSEKTLFWYILLGDKTHYGSEKTLFWHILRGDNDTMVPPQEIKTKVSPIFTIISSPLVLR